jgi:hypothetical protein
MPSAWPRPWRDRPADRRRARPARGSPRRPAWRPREGAGCHIDPPFPDRWLIRVTAERRPGSGSNNRVRSPRPSGAIADRAHVAGSASRPGRTEEGSDRPVRASPLVRLSGGRQRGRPAEMVRGSPRPRPRTRSRQPRPHRWRAGGRGLTSRLCGRRPCRRQVPKRGLPRTQPRVDRCAGPRWLDWPWLLAAGSRSVSGPTVAIPRVHSGLPDGDSGRRPGSFSPSGQSGHGRIRQVGKVEGRGYLDRRRGVLSGRG